MRLAILGAGGHAKVVIGAAEAAGHTIVGVFDDRPDTWGVKILGYAVTGPLKQAAGLDAEGAVLAIGSNAVRRRLVGEMVLPWAAVVHPTAWVHPSVTVGEGAVVFANAVVQPDAQLGSHSIVNTGATIDHECRVGPFVHVGPGAHLSGNVECGEGAFIGTGAAVKEGIKVGSWATVGLGAAVTKDVPPDATVVGVPARPLR